MTQITPFFGYEIIERAPDRGDIIVGKLSLIFDLLKAKICCELLIIA